MKEVMYYSLLSLGDNLSYCTAKLHVQGYQWKNLHYLSQASEPQDTETRQKALFEAWKVSHCWATHIAFVNVCHSNIE